MIKGFLPLAMIEMFPSLEMIIKILFQGSRVMIKNTVNLDDLIGHLNTMLTMLHTDTWSVFFVVGADVTDTAELF